MDLCDNVAYLGDFQDGCTSIGKHLAEFLGHSVTQLSAGKMCFHILQRCVCVCWKENERKEGNRWCWRGGEASLASCPVPGESGLSAACGRPLVLPSIRIAVVCLEKKTISWLQYDWQKLGWCPNCNHNTVADLGIFLSLRYIFFVKIYLVCSLCAFAAWLSTAGHSWACSFPRAWSRPTGGVDFSTRLFALLWFPTSLFRWFEPMKESLPIVTHLDMNTQLVIRRDLQK